MLFFRQKNYEQLRLDLHERVEARIERYERMFDQKVTMREKVAIVATEGFQVSLVTYLLLLLAETIKEGFVSYFFNMNYLLGFVLIAGIVMVLTQDEVGKEHRAKGEEQSAKSREATKLTKWNKQFIFLMSIGGAALVYYKTEALGSLSLIIAGLTAVIIGLLSWLIYSETEN